MKSALKFLTAAVFLLCLHEGVLWGKPEKAGKTRPYTNLTIEQAIDSIEAKLETDEELKPYIVVLLNSGNQDQILAVLENVLLQAKLPLNRAYAAFHLFEIWEKTRDKRIPLILRKALKDSLIDIRIDILWKLHRMGKQIPVDIVEELARGEGKESWAVSVSPPPEGAKSKSREELIEEARDNVQIRAIKLLYEIKGKDAAPILWEILEKMPLGKVWDCAAEIYKKAAPPKKVKIVDYGPGPWTPEQIKEYERQLVEWHRETCKLDLLKWRKWLEQNYKCERSLELIFRTFMDARDLRAIPLLVKVLKYNPRGINRANAAQAIKLIETYNNDRSAIPALIEALKDTVTDVQLKVADALVAMGDTVYSLVVLEKLAKGEGKDSWVVDWAAYMGLGNMSKEEIEKQKVKFRDSIQFKAIDLLGKAGTSRAVKVLRDVAESNPEEWVRRHAKDVLEKVIMKEGKEKGERR